MRRIRKETLRLGKSVGIFERSVEEMGVVLAVPEEREMIVKRNKRVRV